MIFTRLVDGFDVMMRVAMRARARVRPHGIGRTFFGARMHCDLRQFIERRIFYFGIFEPNLSYYIVSRLRPSDHFVDVGANVGYMSLLAAHIVGDSGRVLAIEASPATYQRLTRNIGLNGAQNVMALNVAATDEQCWVDIVGGEPRNSGTTAIRRTRSRGVTAVPGEALSKLMSGSDKAHVRFIKIDVEGSEAPILRDILDNINDFTNLHSMAIELGPKSADFLQMFAAKGFAIYALPNNYRIGYLLIRRYLRRSGEDGFVVKRPVNSYDPRFTDYVFERQQVEVASSMLTRKSA